MTCICGHEETDHLKSGACQATGCSCNAYEEEQEDDDD